MKWKRVDCGSYHCCALDVRGHASCWQMADNVADNEGGMSGQTVVPSDVISWKDISAGWQHTCGITTRGKMLCRYSGYTHTCAVDSERSLHCWGDLHCRSCG
mmetsp:Transcript_37961/g.119805  ORF Transcript_37961/g.119805 Transcript_37961/m.119805 type:complete len:102 (-) Transcript_37961:214-519(-)